MQQLAGAGSAAGPPPGCGITTAVLAGFDARTAFLGPRRGFGRATRSLADALLRLLPGEIELFVPRHAEIPPPWYLLAARVAELARRRPVEVDEEYLVLRALRRNRLFGQFLLAPIRLSEAGSGKCSLLESISNRFEAGSAQAVDGRQTLRFLRPISPREVPRRPRCPLLDGF